MRRRLRSVLRACAKDLKAARARQRERRACGTRVWRNSGHAAGFCRPPPRKGKEAAPRRCAPRRADDEKRSFYNIFGIIGEALAGTIALASSVINQSWFWLAMSVWSFTELYLSLENPEKGNPKKRINNKNKKAKAICLRFFRGDGQPSCERYSSSDKTRPTAANESASGRRMRRASASTCSLLTAAICRVSSSAETASP